MQGSTLRRSPSSNREMVGDSGEIGDEAGGPTGGVGGAGGGGGGAGGFSTVVICESWCCPARVWICGEGEEELARLPFQNKNQNGGAAIPEQVSE